MRQGGAVSISVLVAIFHALFLFLHAGRPSTSYFGVQEQTRTLWVFMVACQGPTIPVVSKKKHHVFRVLASNLYSSINSCDLLSRFNDKMSFYADDTGFYTNNSSCVWLTDLWPLCPVHHWFLSLFLLKLQILQQQPATVKPSLWTQEPCKPSKSCL